MSRFVVTQYEKTRVPGGAIFKFCGAVAGLGRNRGTWDSEHSRSAAYRHAAKLRKERGPDFRFRVESAY